MQNIFRDDSISNLRFGDVTLNISDGKTYENRIVVKPLAVARANATRFADLLVSAAASAYNRKLRKK